MTWCPIHYVLPKKTVLDVGTCSFMNKCSRGKSGSEGSVLLRYFKNIEVCVDNRLADIQLYVILGCEVYPVTL